jgi:hypothetical protein
MTAHITNSLANEPKILLSAGLTRKLAERKRPKLMGRGYTSSRPFKELHGSMVMTISMRMTLKCVAATTVGAAIATW